MGLVLRGSGLPPFRMVRERMGHPVLWVTAKEQAKATAGPSTTLRFAQDDSFIVIRYLLTPYLRLADLSIHLSRVGYIVSEVSGGGH